MKNHIKLQLFICFSVLIVFLYSCSNSDRINVSELSYEQATSIFIKNYLKKPDTVYLPRFKDYFAAQDWDYLYCFKSFANTWQVIYRYTNRVPGIQDVDWTIIDSIPYIYFVSDESGNRDGSITFHIVSLENVDVHYSLTFEGVVGRVDRLYSPISEELKSKKEILEYLENKIANSNLIYRPSRDDLNINHPKNHILKWEIENKNILDRVKNCDEESSDIKFFYYSENLFNLWSDYEISNIMNEKFVIKCFFYKSGGYYNYHIIGHNKSKNTYFVVWSGTYIDDPNDFTSEIKFLSKDLISIKIDIQTFLINLNDGELNCI